MESPTVELNVQEPDIPVDNAVVWPPELEPQTTPPSPNPLLVQVPYNYEAHADPMKAQMGYFRSLVDHLTSGILFHSVSKSISYRGDLVTRWVRVMLGQTSVQLTLNDNQTILQTSYLRNTICLPGLDTTLAGSMLLEAVFEKLDYKVNMILPQFVLADGFPIKPVNVKYVSFDSQNSATPMFMENWMPHLRGYDWICPGRIETADDEERCLTMCRTYFKEVEGVDLDYASVTATNALRCMLPSLRISNSKIPTGQFMRWFKAWALGVKGFSHLSLVHVVHPTIKYNNRIFQAFFRKVVRDETNAVTFRNALGAFATVRVETDGSLLFLLGKTSPSEQIPLTDLRRLYRKDDYSDKNEIDAKFDMIDKRHKNVFGSARTVEGSPKQTTTSPNQLQSPDERPLPL